MCDGSIIPVPLGTNPALTIAALAERIAARTKPPVGDRSGRGSAPSRIRPSAPGIRYTERLRGWMEVGETRTRLELVLHISAESIDELLNDSRHEARIIGVARTPDLPDVRRFTVSDGSLNVFIDDPRNVDTRLLVYRLTLTGVSSDADKVDGTDVSNDTLWLYGYKRINLETCRRGTWRAISRLPFMIYRTEPPTSKTAMEPVIAAQVCNAIDRWSGSNGSAPADAAGGGLVASRVVDALRLIASLQVMYERRLRARVRIRARYAWYFAGVIFQARVWPLRPALRADPLNRPDLQRHAPSIERLPDLQDNRQTGPPRFLLTRYVNPSKVASSRPPVILAPGFGMSSDAFLVGKRSMVEHLCNAGYEVVLLDYRGSDRIDLSLSQFTLDDLVGDFCDAIELVHTTTGQPVRFIGHCVASLTMLMALLSGGPKGEGIKGLHSVVLSQSFAFLDHPWTNRLKARLRLPHILKYLRFREVLTPDYDLRSRWVSHLLDRLLHFYPTRERCTSGVCRRLLLLYGEVVRHDQLDQATHALLYDLFDRANLTSLEHLAKMVARGRIVDARGRDVYVTEQAAKNINVPITLLQGGGNRLFRPSGARATYHWLLEHGRFGPRNPEMFSLREIPGVGHLDTFIGRDAADRVFPAIDDALEQMQFQMSRP